MHRISTHEGPEHRNLYELERHFLLHIQSSTAGYFHSNNVCSLTHFYKYFKKHPDCVNELQKLKKKKKKTCSASSRYFYYTKTFHAKGSLRATLGSRVLSVLQEGLLL